MQTRLEGAYQLNSTGLPKAVIAITYSQSSRRRIAFVSSVRCFNTPMAWGVGTTGNSTCGAPLRASLLSSLAAFMHSSADYQPSGISKECPLDRKGCVSEPVAELFRRLFFALADLIAVNHHVVVAGDAIDVVSNRRKTCRSA